MHTHLYALTREAVFGTSIGPKIFELRTVLWIIGPMLLGHLPATASTIYFPAGEVRKNDVIACAHLRWCIAIIL